MTQRDGAPLVLGCSAPERYGANRTSTRSGRRASSNSRFDPCRARMALTSHNVTAPNSTNGRQSAPRPRRHEAYEHLMPCRLRTRRLGVRVPSGAKDQGRDQQKRRLRPWFFPSKCRDLPDRGSLVLRWCSSVSRRSVLVCADQCFCVSPSLDHHFAPSPRCPLWSLLLDLCWTVFALRLAHR